MPTPRRIEKGAFERRNAEACSRLDLIRDAGDELYTDLADRLTDAGTEVLSLDVFDTLLLRNDKPEAQRYFELSERLATEFSDDGRSFTAADFYVARSLGMQVSYRARPDLDTCREGHIDEVIRSQLAQLGLDVGLLDRVKQVEVEYECENVSINDVLLRLCQDFKAKGGSVILLSDMYLDGETIAQIIKSKVDSTEFFHQLSSSADTVYSKRSGHVFRLMEEKLEKPPESFYHIGDSLVSDVISAKRAGWRALHFPVSDAEAIRREQGLRAFKAHMREGGLDVTRWAKV